MGYWKDRAIEEMDRLEHLCEVCEERPREVDCSRCGELSLCKKCALWTSLCGYCRHIVAKDD